MCFQIQGEWVSLVPVEEKSFNYKYQQQYTTNQLIYIGV